MHFTHKVHAINIMPSAHPMIQWPVALLSHITCIRHISDDKNGALKQRSHKALTGANTLYLPGKSLHPLHTIGIPGLHPL